MVKDPVCGMQIDELTAKARSEHRGKVVSFCSPGCKEKFDQNPEPYAQQRA